MKNFLNKYREIIVYIIVGVLTTIFCWVLCYILEHFVFDAEDPIQNFVINTVDWIAGVLFAYPLNRKWVFKSSNPRIFKEFMGFAGSRVSTWALDVVIMWFFVNICPLTALSTWAAGVLLKIGINMDVTSVNFWIAKIFISSVLVMIANYVFSKLLIFKKKKAPRTEETVEAKEASAEDEVRRS